MTTLGNKHALVTGGGSGAGAAIATALADAGAKVTICGRREEPLQAISDSYANIDYTLCDVSDEKSVLSMFERIAPVDIAIANAGSAISNRLGRTDLDSWQQMLNVNLTGVFLTWREAQKQMPKDWGRLIVVASTAGLKGYAYTAAYTAAKHGAVGLTRAVALEVARSGITANALCPGFLDTPMTDASIDNITSRTELSESQAREELAKNNPQKRLIDPIEVAAAVLWLCGAGSEGINGQAIPIAGGEV